jgi:hypothetical protein
MFSSFFSLESRKKNTKYIIDTISESLFKITGKENTDAAAKLLIFLHMNAMTFMLYNLIVSDVSVLFYFLTFVWFILISLNYYFHGCILAKIERELLQDETWAGPANIMLYPIHLFYKPNTQILNDYVKYFWSVPTTVIIILRYLINDDSTNIFIGVALCFILMPLLFIRNPDDLFSYLL